MPEPIPMDCLPRPIRDVASDMGRRLCVPEGYFAGPALQAAGSLIQIGVKGRDGFHVFPNLWLVLSAPSGSMKSAPAGLAIRPLQLLEEKWLEEYAAARVTFERENLLWQAEKKRLQRAVDEGGPEADEAAARLASGEPKPPVRRRILITDSTPEKTALLLLDNPGGLLAWTDELALRLDGGSKAGREDQHSLDLAAFEASGSFSVDRVGRPSLVIPRPRLAIGGTTQPAVLRGFIGKARMDGWFERPIYLEYQDLPAFEENDLPRDAGAESRYFSALMRLADMDPQDVGAQLHESGGFWFLPLAADAKGLYTAWISFVEQSVRLPIWQDRARLASWLGKTRSLVLKLALISHLLEDGRGAIPSTQLARAISLTISLLGHAEAVLSDPDVAGVPPEVAIAEAVIDGTLRENFTARDVKRLHRSGLDARAVERGLETLVLNRYLYKQTDKDKGGRPTSFYGPLPRLTSEGFDTFGTGIFKMELLGLFTECVLSRFPEVGTFGASIYKEIKDKIHIYTNEEILMPGVKSEKMPALHVLENPVPEVPKAPRPASTVSGRIYELIQYAPMDKAELIRKSGFTAFSVESALKGLVSEGTVCLSGDVYAIKD